MKIKKENNRVRKYDWAIFASSYFLIAKLACQELLSEREEKHSMNGNLNTPYKPIDLYISILFNIKHGIEVFVKTLSVFAYGEYEEGHDIKTLFDNAKEKISKLNLEPRQKGFYNDISQDDINASFEDLNKIENLVLYFFQLDFLRQKLSNDFIIKDTLNDFLRYPDSKVSIRIDWGTILNHRILSSDIKEILTKLDELHNLFNKTGRLHAIVSY